jgi:hypothetical protein
LVIGSNPIGCTIFFQEKIMQVAKTVLYKSIKRAITDKAKLKEIRENLENLQKSMNIHVDLGHNDLGCCFIWDYTPQGRKYWYDIHSIVRQHIQELKL